MAIKAVEWVRRVRDAQCEETRNMTFEQRREFYRAKSAALLRKIGKGKDGKKSESRP
ncbi:MAG: hypothetical protein LLG01_14420 [Planctomycetaceae bacterium]|nr:hypothetical protein [Planctomycetaceae bacterium]